MRACITDAHRSAAERCSSFAPALGAGVGSSLDSDDRVREDEQAGDSRVRAGRKVEGERAMRRGNVVAIAGGQEKERAETN